MNEEVPKKKLLSLPKLKKIKEPIKIEKDIKSPEKCSLCYGRGEIPSTILSKVSDKDVDHWANQEWLNDKQQYSKHNFWTENKFTISMVLLFLAVIMVTFIVTDHMGSVAGACSSALSACSDMAKSCAGVAPELPPVDVPAW